ncbi:MAG: DUF4340 domain-containing protein [Anaerolineae bacterium]|nr:DUF4340 domain-containing protein [Anaerolineae bacterium]
MRLNRGTLLIIVAALVVIGAVLVINNNQANAPEEETPTVAPGAGPIFDEVAGNDVLRLEVVANTFGDSTVLTQSAGGAWSIPEATYATSRDTDQSKAQEVVGDFVLLESSDRFDSETLADFGLDTPAYIVTADLADGTRQTLYIGNQNPTGNRYYALLETGETPADLSEQLSQQAEATAEVTEEAMTGEATAEMTAEATEEMEATAEATVEAVAEATEEPTEEATPEPYNSVTLSSTSGMVYIIQKTSLDPIIGLVAEPPYIEAPTATPTATATLNPLSEVDIATITAEANLTATAVFAEIQTQAAATETAMATEEATAEVTAEATAEPAS